MQIDKRTLLDLKNLLDVMEDDIANRGMYDRSYENIRAWIKKRRRN